MRKRGLCCRPVSVRLSRSRIVSRRLKISSNFFVDLVVPSICFLTPCADTQFQGELHQQGREVHGVEKFCDFRLKSPFISETVRGRPMVTYGTLIGYHKWRIKTCRFRWLWVTLTRVSRSLCSLFLYKSNISKAVHFRDSNSRTLIGNHTTWPLNGTISMTLTDLWFGFKGHDIFRHWISQKRH